LRWLRNNGYNAPKTTPPAGKKYRELELAFIAEGKKRGLSPKDWDTLFAAALVDESQLRLFF